TIGCKFGGASMSTGAGPGATGCGTGAGAGAGTGTGCGGNSSCAGGCWAESLTRQDFAVGRGQLVTVPPSLACAPSAPNSSPADGIQRTFRFPRPLPGAVRTGRHSRRRRGTQERPHLNPPSLPGFAGGEG